MTTAPPAEEPKKEWMAWLHLCVHCRQPGGTMRRIGTFNRRPIYAHDPQSNAKENRACRDAQKSAPVL